MTPMPTTHSMLVGCLYDYWTLNDQIDARNGSSG